MTIKQCELAQSKMNKRQQIVRKVETLRGMKWDRSSLVLHPLGSREFEVVVNGADAIGVLDYAIALYQQQIKEIEEELEKL